MSVRDEIKDYLAKSPNATPEEIAKGLAITKIEVLGHLNVIRANVQPPATVALPDPIADDPEVTVAAIEALAVAAKAAGDAGLVGSLDPEPDPDEAVAAIALANDPEPEMPDFDPSVPLACPTGNGWIAADISALFTSGAVMDIYAAAEFLGVQRNSVEYAVIRGTLPCAEIRGKKLFGRADLEAYADKRAPGRKSRLTK